MMMQRATAKHAGSEGPTPLSSRGWQRVSTTLREQCLWYGGAQRQRKSCAVLVVRCASRARRTLKDKRHALHPPQNHVLELVSALTVEDSDHYAALNYHSKSMALSDWFLLLEELGRMNQWLLTLEVFRWMQQQKWYRPDDGFYAKIISILGKQGHLRYAIWLFKEMKKHGCRPDSSVLNSLINAHLRNINKKEVALVKALGYYEMMKKTTRCRPNLVTYNTLLRACAQAKQTEKIEELLKEMEQEGFKPDIYTFNGMLDAHGKAGDFSKMEEVLQTMKKNRVQADCITFNTLMDAYGKAGVITKMEETLKAMAVAKVTPQLPTFNMLINNYGSAKRVNEMETVFKNMSSMGIPPSLITYEILMKGYGNCGCFKKMRTCLNEMHEAGLKPEATTLNAVMEVYCTYGLFEEAESLLDNVGDLGVAPTSLSYLILHRAYLKHGCVDKVEALLKRMEAAGIKPNEKFISQWQESSTVEAKRKDSTNSDRGNHSRKEAAGLRRSRDSRQEAAVGRRGNNFKTEASSSRGIVDSNKAVLLHAK